MKAFWIILAIVAVVIVFVGLNQKNSKVTKTNLKDNSYQGLRDMVFALTYDSINLDDKREEKPIFALMELGMSGAVVTVVTVAEGSTSLYLSTGGGVIGGGTHESVKTASEIFMKQSKNFLDFMTRDEDHVLPSEGQVCFYVKTSDGVYRCCSQEKYLENGKDKLSNLYTLGQNVITELRKISQ